jgi:hypothetical protein
MRVETGMNPLMQKEQAHRVDGRVVKAGIGEDKSPTRSEQPTHPGLDAVSQLPDKEQPLFEAQFTVRDGQAKVEEREGPQFAIQLVGDPDLFVSRLAHDNDFALVVVNLEAGHVLEAHEKELEVGNIFLRVLYQDEGVVRVLKVGNASGKEVRDYSVDVTR